MVGVEYIRIPILDNNYFLRPTQRNKSRFWYYNTISVLKVLMLVFFLQNFSDSKQAKYVKLINSEALKFVFINAPLGFQAAIEPWKE